MVFPSLAGKESLLLLRYFGLYVLNARSRTLVAMSERKQSGGEKLLTGATALSSVGRNTNFCRDFSVEAVSCCKIGDVTLV